MMFPAALPLFLASLGIATAELSSLPIISHDAIRGSLSNQDVSILGTRDFTSPDAPDDWDKYIEVSAGNSNKFVAQFDFDASSISTDVNENNIQSIEIHTNTIGLDKSQQMRFFQIRNFEIGRWVTLGNNAAAESWQWFEESFTLTGSKLFEYIHPQNSFVRIRFRSNNDEDVSNVDWLEVVVDVDGGDSLAATATPTTSPTDQVIAATGRPTSRPTSVPVTSPPTVSPTDRPVTSSPTSSPTARPVTSSPTSRPTLSPTDRPVGTDSWWKPKSSDALTWQWQLQGSIDTSFNVDMYDIDLFDVPASQIKDLQDMGHTVVCYFSAGTYEGWRDDWQQFFPFITGGQYNGDEKPFAGKMDEWDERWLDISEIDLLKPIMRSRLELAVAKGCDAVEPDNMDAYTNGGETELSLTFNEQLAYNKWLAAEAHSLGMSIGLKNDVDQLAELVDHFDWALNEQCFQYNECNGYADTFVAQKKAVFGVEYTLDVGAFCPQANAMGLSWLKKEYDLTATRVGCEDYV